MSGIEANGLSADASKSKLAACGVLHQVYKGPHPPKANKYISLTSCGIIAVHGFGGAWDSTWTYPSSPYFFWLKDGLGIDVPHYSVWSYSYESNAQQSNENVARGLLSVLYDTFQTEDSRSTPIIFFAEGLGGLTVKDALVRSCSSDRFKFVQFSTRATFFFGTPHRWSSAASGAKALARLVPRPGGFTTEDAAQIGIINDRFVHFAPRQTIACFYETAATGEALILDRTSSTLNLPGSVNIALQADHSGLTKYQGRHDLCYKRVLQTLRSIDISRRGQMPSPLTPPSAIPDMGPSLQFEANLQIFRPNGTLISGRVTITDSGADSSLLKAVEDMQGSRLIWLHVSLNNSSWVQFCLRSLISALLGNDEYDIPIMDAKYWSDNERHNPSIPHSRYMDPGCHFIPGRTDLALYMPYLHWDTYFAFERRNSFISRCHEKPQTQIPDGLLPTTKRLYQAIKDDIDGPNSLHPRRSLDQYFYPNLNDTSSRDKDQVVWRHTQKALGGPTMIMVDQLWLWVVEIPSLKSHQTAILTCFPEKEEDLIPRNGVESDTDLYQAILNELQSDETKNMLQESYDFGEEINGAEVAGIIIERAMNKMLTYKDPSLDFLSIFRDSIGQATDKTTEYFRKFRDALEPRRGQPRPLSDKRAEAKLVLEVLDIIDELNSISRLLQTQKDKLLHTLQLPSDEQRVRLLQRRIAAVVNKDLDGYLDQVKRMSEDAERTRTSLMNLLDLQQKEESLDLARLAKEQADETQAQSQILMLFTIVTIVFLPLSFFTSYYGMNVTEFTGEPGNTDQKAVWKVMGPISFAIILFLLGYAVMLYVQAKRKREASSDGTTDPTTRAAGAGLLPKLMRHAFSENNR